MDNYVIPKFGAMRLADITRTEAQMFFNRLLRTLEASSVRRIKIVFSGVMNVAEDDALIPRNPVARVRLPMAEDPGKTALTFEQLGKLVATCPKGLLPPVVFMCCSLNVGEACAVRRTHLSGGVLKVRRQILQLKGGAQDVAKLKTPQRKRDIPLPERVVELVLNCDQASSIWLSSNETGGYLLPNNVQRELEKIVGTKDVPRVTPHELRHTFISLMENELECPPAIVSAIAGKRDKRVNAGYSHAHMEQMRRWMEKFWARVLDQTSTGSVDTDGVRLA